jgi:hypothetical protein
MKVISYLHTFTIISKERYINAQFNVTIRRAIAGFTLNEMTVITSKDQAP